MIQSILSQYLDPYDRIQFNDILSKSSCFLFFKWNKKFNAFVALNLVFSQDLIKFDISSQAAKISKQQEKKK